MDVLRHKDVAEEIEVVRLTDSLQCFFKDGAGVVVLEKRGALVTTEGDEVIAALGLVSLQRARHEDIVTSFSRPRAASPHPSAKCCVWMGHP